MKENLDVTVRIAGERWKDHMVMKITSYKNIACNRFYVIISFFELIYSGSLVHWPVANKVHIPSMEPATNV